MFKKPLTTIFLLSALLFIGCGSDNGEKIDTKVAKANSMISANEYVLTALDKKQYIVKKESSGFKIKGEEGKIVIFDIFATWCPPCRGAATHLSALQKKFKDKLIVIGLTIENDIEDSKLLEFRDMYDANYVLVNSDQNRRLIDAIVKELALGERYPIPIMVLYKDGKYINHFVGSIEEEFVASEIKLALEK